MKRMPAVAAVAVLLAGAVPVHADDPPLPTVSAWASGSAQRMEEISCDPDTLANPVAENYNDQMAELAGIINNRTGDGFFPWMPMEEGAEPQEFCYAVHTGGGGGVNPWGLNGWASVTSSTAPIRQCIWVASAGQSACFVPEDVVILFRKPDSENRCAWSHAVAQAAPLDPDESHLDIFCN